MGESCGQIPSFPCPKTPCSTDVVVGAGAEILCIQGGAVADQEDPSLAHRPTLLAFMVFLCPKNLWTWKTLHIITYITYVYDKYIYIYVCIYIYIFTYIISYQRDEMGISEVHPRYSYVALLLVIQK